MALTWAAGITLVAAVLLLVVALTEKTDYQFREESEDE